MQSEEVDKLNNTLSHLVELGKEIKQQYEAHPSVKLILLYEQAKEFKKEDQEKGLLHDETIEKIDGMSETINENIESSETFKKMRQAKEVMNALAHATGIIAKMILKAESKTEEVV
jgi:hypothetical protein